MRYNTKNLIEHADEVFIIDGHTQRGEATNRTRKHFDGEEGWMLEFASGAQFAVVDQFVTLDRVDQKAYFQTVLNETARLGFYMKTGQGLNQLEYRIRSQTSGVLREPRTWGHLDDIGQRRPQILPTTVYVIDRDAPYRPLLDLISLGITQVEANPNALTRGTEYRRAIEQAVRAVLGQHRTTQVWGKLTLLNVNPARGPDRPLQLELQHEWHEVRVTGRHYYEQRITVALQ